MSVGICAVQLPKISSKKQGTTCLQQYIKPPAHGRKWAGTGRVGEIGGTRQAQNENYTKVCQRGKWHAFLWLPKMPPGVDVGARVVESGKPTLVVAEKKAHTNKASFGN